jgi:hypothetical protein
VIVSAGAGIDLSKTPYLSLIQGIIRRERLWMPMRRLCLILLCGLVAAPAALAGASVAGDGVLELRTVDATVLIAGRGVVWGQMDKGKLVVNDIAPGGDGEILVSGAERKVPGSCDACTVYTGKDIHFRVTGGKYRLFFDGAGIDLSAVGVGSAQLTGHVTVDDPGDWALDGGKWTAVPWLKRTVLFGVQPVLAPVGP